MGSHRVFSATVTILTTTIAVALWNWSGEYTVCTWQDIVMYQLQPCVDGYVTEVPTTSFQYEEEKYACRLIVRNSVGM